MMIGNGVRFMTGMAARLGLGPVLRLLVFAAMCWGVWCLVASGSVVAIHDWVVGMRHPGGFFGTLIGAVGLIVGVVTAFVLADEHKWGLWEHVRRAPFLLWCGLTDDNETIHLGTLLLWPLIAVADWIVSILLLVAVVAVGVVELMTLKVKGGSGD